MLKRSYAMFQTQYVGFLLYFGVCMYLCVHVCVCVYLCMNVCACVYSCVCICIYLCVHVCGGQKLVLEVFFHHVLHSVLRKGFSLDLMPLGSARLAGERTPGNLPSLSDALELGSQRLIMELSFCFYTVGAEDWTRIPLLVERTLYQLHHLQSLVFFFSPPLGKHISTGNHMTQANQTSYWSKPHVPP